MSKASSAKDAATAAADLRTSLWERPGFLIRRLHQIHVALFLEESREFDVTPVQYALMTTLLLTPGLDQISLARDAGVDRTNVADVLQRLEQRGILTREVSDHDRRVKLAYLTPEGEDLTRQMEEAVLVAQARFVAPLNKSERAELNRLLTALVDANNDLSRAPIR
jgi:DNA-binding MarR family transcriptional regulator